MTKRIVVYGGSGGIGSATARLLQARGYTLHLVGRNGDALSSLSAQLQTTYTQGDVCDETLFTQVGNDFPAPWDGLVYSIGTITIGSIRRLTRTDFLQDFQINAMGAALAVQAGLAALKKSNGSPSVVLFSSVAALQGFTFHSSIGMAKGAVSGLTLALAAELAPKIRVNAIAPSLTRTPLADSILSNEAITSAIKELHPLKIIGEPDDIANFVAYLLSEEAGWVTGQVISIDGGRSTLRPKG
mgnify:CR=1 FL=1